MRWTLQELDRYGTNPVVIDEEIDFQEAVQKHKSLRTMSRVSITGEGTRSENQYIFNLRIKGVMTLGCAVSNKDVQFPFDIHTYEIFTEEEDDLESDNIHTISKQVIDIMPIIWQNIVMEIPIRVISDDLDDVQLNGNGWNLIDEDEYHNQSKNKVDPRFEKLLSLIDDEK